MKKIVTVALATAFSSALLLNATDAAAQASAAAAKPATTAAKPAAAAHPASHAKAPVKHAAHPAARHPIKKKIAALVPSREPFRPMPPNGPAPKATRCTRPAT